MTVLGEVQIQLLASTSLCVNVLAFTQGCFLFKAAFICVICGHEWLAILAQEFLSRMWSFWERHTCVARVKMFWCSLHMFTCSPAHSPAVNCRPGLQLCLRWWLSSQVLLGIPSLCMKVAAWFPESSCHISVPFTGELSPQRLARRVSAAWGFTSVSAGP